MNAETDRLVAIAQRLKAVRAPSMLKMNSETWKSLVKDSGAIKEPSAYTHLIGIPVEMDETVPTGTFQEVY